MMKIAAFALLCATPVLAASPAASPKPPIGQIKLPTLSYTIETSGPAEGAHPARKDMVTVNYTLTLLDGTLIDQSKTPATFALNKLVPAWQILVPLMRPGDKWKFFVPPEYAYGAITRGPIPANSNLIFEVELLSSAPPPADPAK